MAGTQWMASYEVPGRGSQVERGFVLSQANTGAPVNWVSTASQLHSILLVHIYACAIGRLPAETGYLF